MRLASLAAVALATAASRGGCGASSAPHDPCAGKACGAECVADPPCRQSDPPCELPSYVGQCDPQGICAPPATAVTCGAMAACDGKSCGDECNPCSPLGCMSPVAYRCDAAHQCVAYVPDCAAPPPGCTYGGITYASGDTFPAGDGCNTCQCLAGSVVCTYHTCIAN